MVIGLGNPGREFEGSRHNYGADAVRLLAARHHTTLKNEKGARAATASVRVTRHEAVPEQRPGTGSDNDAEAVATNNLPRQLRVVLAVPQTYMNESGIAARALARRYLGADRHTDHDHLVIVHDELDLPPGVVRVKQGGGLAGNNGLRSIRDHLHHTDFVRVRIGIGKPPSSRQGVDHVLRRPSKADSELLAIATETAADAVDTILTDGVVAAMNRFNSKS